MIRHKQGYGVSLSLLHRIHCPGVMRSFIRDLRCHACPLDALWTFKEKYGNLLEQALDFLNDKRSGLSVAWCVHW
jgi:hypothetical protein